MSVPGASPQRVIGLPTDRFRVDGTTALVTGGSRNIGASIAMAFAQAGADVARVGRTAGALEDLAGAAVYLASPAASYTTGTVIFCNGGTTW